MYENTYGCCNLLTIYKYKYKCDSCNKTVTPETGNKTTKGSPGYIFICPECSHTAFAYRSDKAQSLVK